MSVYLKIKSDVYQKLLEHLGSENKVNTFANQVLSRSVSNQTSNSYEDTVGKYIPSKQINDKKHTLFLDGAWYDYRLENQNFTWQIKPNQFYKVVDCDNDTLVLVPVSQK